MGRLVRAAMVLAVVAFGAAGCSSEPPDATLKAFLAAWQQGKLSGQDRLVTDGGQPMTGDAAQTQLSAIEGDLAANRPTLAVKGKPAVKNDRATATVTVTWPVAAGVSWTYDTTVAMRRVDDRWRVEFTPKTVQTEQLRPTLVYEVRVFVRDPDDVLRLGMPATVHVPLK